MATPAPETKFLKDLLSQDEATARWYIRTRTGHEYRTQAEIPAGTTGMVGLYTSEDDDADLEYLRLDQIEAIRRMA